MKSTVFFCLTAVLATQCCYSQTSEELRLRLIGDSPRKTGPLKTLTILIKHPRMAPAHSAKEMESIIYNDLNDYVKWCSYGKAWLEGKAIGWLPIPGLNLSGFNLFNKKIDAYGVHDFIEGALAYAERHEDLANYDHFVLIMGTRGRPYGFNGMAGPFEDFPFKLRNGKIIRHISLYSEFAHLGQIAHDFFHQIGGTKGKGKWGERERVCPCLYSNDLESTPGGFMGVKYFAAYMGPWDIMSLHRIGMDIPPIGISSFTRMRLGWLKGSNIKTVSRRKGVTSLTLSPLSDGAGQTLAVKVPIGRETYYLLENRQPVGYDRVAPDEGVIIYRVDDSVFKDRERAWHGPVRIMNADPSWPRFRKPTYNLERPIYVDEKNDLAVVVEGKEGGSYRLSVIRGLRGTIKSSEEVASKVRAAQDKMSRLKALPTMEDVKKTIVLKAKDGFRVQADYYRNAESKIAVLMIPGYDGSAESLEPLPYIFYRSGVTTLAMDLRTLKRFRGQVAGGTALKGEFAPLPEDLNPVLHDIETGRQFLKDEGFDAIGILGASYGGSLALKTAFKEKGIKAAVVFSLPFANWGAINIRSDLANSRFDLPLLFIYTTDDIVAPTVKKIAPALERLCRKRGRMSQIKSFPGLSHGNDILRSHPELEEYLVGWFERALGR